MTGAAECHHPFCCSPNPLWCGRPTEGPLAKPWTLAPAQQWPQASSWLPECCQAPRTLWAFPDTDLFLWFWLPPKPWQVAMCWEPSALPLLSGHIRAECPGSDPWPAASCGWGSLLAERPSLVLSKPCAWFPGRGGRASVGPSALGSQGQQRLESSRGGGRRACCCQTGRGSLPQVLLPVTG